MELIHEPLSWMVLVLDLVLNQTLQCSLQTSARACHRLPARASLQLLVAARVCVPARAHPSTDYREPLLSLLPDDGNKRDDLTAAHGHWPADLEPFSQSRTDPMTYGLQRRL